MIFVHSFFTEFMVRAVNYGTHQSRFFSYSLKNAVFILKFLNLLAESTPWVLIPRRAYQII